MTRYRVFRCEACGATVLLYDNAEGRLWHGSFQHMTKLDNEVLCCRSPNWWAIFSPKTVCLNDRGFKT